MSEKRMLFTKDHEWVLVEGTIARIGITEYAQNELGDVVFVDLPTVGDTVEEGEGFAVVESVKAVSDVYACGRHGCEGKRGVRVKPRADQ